MSSTTTYNESPTGSTYRTRREELIAHTLEMPGTGPYTELVRLMAGAQIDPNLLLGAVAKLNERVDCADFLLHGILAILYRFPEPDDPEADPIGDVRDALEGAVIGFKYWPDEPGTDSMCTWTENHQIMFAAGAYLAGQLFPDVRFTNSRRTGREQMNRFRPRIERWLDLRFRSGFSEWLSHVYYNEDLPPLLNLVEFAHDPKLVRGASIVIDIMLLDIAINSFRGTFGASHGRSYERHKKDGGRESTGPVLRLVAGTNRARAGNMSATLLALATRYHVPSVIPAIANDTERPEMENRQRMGIRVDQAESWGLGFRSLEDGMVFLSLEAYLHERTASLTLRMFDEFRWWENDLFAPFAARRGLIETARRLGLVRPLVRLLEKDVTRNTREEVNLSTFRTPDYMLSCAQDYRAGFGGDQQHIWQATLGPRAIVFTTHPGRAGHDGEGPTPTYWTGSGTLPRAAHYRNVVICWYRVDTRRGLYHTNRELATHAWFPMAEFDDVHEADGWVIARRGAGYVALWSRQPYEWRTDVGPEADDAPVAPNELVVPGTNNLWICVCGRATTHGSFDEFAASVTDAPVKVTGRGARERVEIDLMPHGRIAFGWRGPLTVGGWAMPITTTAAAAAGPIAEQGYRRYENPYVTADFPANVIRVRAGDESLLLNWRDQARTANAFL